MIHIERISEIVFAYDRDYVLITTEISLADLSDEERDLLERILPVSPRTWTHLRTNATLSRWHFSKQFPVPEGVLPSLLSCDEQLQTGDVLLYDE
jgi:hypothetical protein